MLVLKISAIAYVINRILPDNFPVIFNQIDIIAHGNPISKPIYSCMHCVGGFLGFYTPVFTWFLLPVMLLHLLLVYLIKENWASMIVPTLFVLVDGINSYFPFLEFEPYFSLEMLSTSLLAMGICHLLIIIESKIQNG